LVAQVEFVRPANWEPNSPDLASQAADISKHSLGVFNATNHFGTTGNGSGERCGLC